VSGDRHFLVKEVSGRVHPALIRWILENQVPQARRGQTLSHKISLISDA